MYVLQKLWARRTTALLLAILLLQGHLIFGQAVEERLADAKDTYDAALKDYQDELYALASAKLEQTLRHQGLYEADFEARIIFLLGASYEMMGNLKNAKEYYLRLKKMNENGAINHIPVVPGVNTEALSIYQEVFEKSFFQFREPVAAADLLDRNVLHAPQKSIEEKQKERRKRKFPGLIAVGAVVVIGTAVLLLFSRKSSRKNMDPQPVE